MENASDDMEHHWALRYKSRKGNAGYAWLVNYCNSESGKPLDYPHRYSVPLVNNRHRTIASL